MNYLKTSFVLGALACALTANAQFGAVGKSDLQAEDGKSGVLVNAYYLDQSVNINGGGTAKSKGFLANFEKALEGGERFSTISAFIYRQDSNNWYNVSYKTYLGENYGVIGGINFGDNASGYNIYGFYDFVPEDDESSTLKFQVGGGLERFDGDSHLAVFGRVSYPLQKGFSLEGGVLARFVSGANAYAITAGVGYRF